MKTVWFIYPYGPIPSEHTSADCRYVRFGKALAAQGYNCVWWTANFSHGKKNWRCKGWGTEQVCENMTIELVPAAPYSKNISLRRALFEMKFASNLGKKIKKIAKPDLIMTSGTGMLTAFKPCWPYMKLKSVPVIYDIMDVHMLNSYMSEHHKLIAPFVKLFTKINENRERSFYQNVSGVTALGSGQLEIAKARTGNRDIPSLLVYNGVYVDEFRQKMNNPCKVSLPAKEDGWVWCVYAGSFGPSYDIKTIIKCAEMCKEKELKIRFIIAGGGQNRDMVENASKTNDRFVYVGSVPFDDLMPLYRNCDIGLCTYTAFSTVDMPDKFYDYCSAGLATVNSLRGEISKHISESHLGRQYESENSQSLFDAIVSLAENDLEACKRNAYAIGDRFNLKNQVIPLIEMIDELTSK